MEVVIPDEHVDDFKHKAVGSCSPTILLC